MFLHRSDPIFQSNAQLNTKFCFCFFFFYYTLYLSKLWLGRLYTATPFTQTKSGRDSPSSRFFQGMGWLYVHRLWLGAWTAFSSGEPFPGSINCYLGFLQVFWSCKKLTIILYSQLSLKFGSHMPLMYLRHGRWQYQWPCHRCIGSIIL